MTKRFLLPENTLSACKILHDNGFQVNLVGGCVRDLFIRKEPKDFDINTNANLEEIKKCFTDAGAYIVDVNGANEHGIVFVNFNHERFEIATYRSDGSYIDNRHCEIVTGVDLYEDLSRRDFTINAMAYNPFSGELFDYFDGERDLSKKLIRTVGEPLKRFGEDALRILRMYRFSSQLGFNIDKDTREAAISLSRNLSFVSAERKREEITKILLSKPDTLLDMYKDGILKLVLPDFDKCFKCEQNSPYHFCDVGRHTITVINNIKTEPLLRWAALLHDIGKPLTKFFNGTKDTFHGHCDVGAELSKDILYDFKYDNDFIKQVCILVKHHDDLFPSKKSIRKFVGKYGNAAFENLLQLKEADAHGHRQEACERLLKEIDDIRNEYNSILRDDGIDRLTLSNLAVNGHDLLDMGIPEGEEIGFILSGLYEKVLDNPTLNSKESLLSFIPELQDEFLHQFFNPSKDR